MRGIRRHGPERVSTLSGSGLRLQTPRFPPLEVDQTKGPSPRHGQTGGVAISNISTNINVITQLNTLVRYKTFHTMIGTINMGIPMYAATKVDADQFPLRKT